MLGAFSNHESKLTTAEEIYNRVKQIVPEYLPLDRLALSPDCGLAILEDTGLIREKLEWKLIKRFFFENFC